MTIAMPVKQLTLEQLADKIRPHLKAMDEAEQAALLRARDAGRWLKSAKARCHAEGHPLEQVGARQLRQVQADGGQLHPHLRQLVGDRGRANPDWQAHDDPRGHRLPRTEQATGRRAGDHEEEEAEGQAQRPTAGGSTGIPDERGVQADPTSFMSTLADFDIPLKKIIERLDILAIRLREQKIGEWLNTLQDGHPPWEEACDLYGVDPEVMAAAAAEAGEPVIRLARRLVERRELPPRPGVRHAHRGHPQRLVLLREKPALLQAGRCGTQDRRAARPGR